MNYREGINQAIGHKKLKIIEHLSNGKPHIFEHFIKNYMKKFHYT